MYSDLHAHSNIRTYLLGTHKVKYMQCLDIEEFSLDLHEDCIYLSCNAILKIRKSNMELCTLQLSILLMYSLFR